MKHTKRSGNGRRIVGTAVALVIGLASGTFAGIGNALADTFQGSIWTLTYSGSPIADSDPLNETFLITLDVDTTGYTGGGLFLDEVAIKVSPSVVGASLVDAPGGASAWTLSAGGINGGGCSGAGGGFECADSGLTLNGGFGLDVGFDYEWVFELTMPNDTLLTGLNESSVKGRFVGPGGQKVGYLVSENVTLTSTSPVPEPEIYALMAAGLGLMGFVARRRKLQIAAA